MVTNTIFPLARPACQTDNSAGLAVLALLLALTLGLSAADIQRERVSKAQAVSSAGTDMKILDGRGKWGGYL
ncbi:MAG: hypothetical protein AAGA21_05145 [Pseudomonadota bacterium]